MPNLGRLIKSGASGPMFSTIPPISGPAWLSLATGMRPENTSVYDFLNRKDDSYRLQGVTSADCAGRAIWDYLSKAGKRVGILNYPICVPPYAVNGFMTAGFLASPDSVFTYPAGLKQELNEAAGGEYELSVPYHDVRYNDTGLFLSDMQRVLDKKLRAASCLLREKQWDFFWVVISETDWLQHIMWRHIDESHPLHEGEASKRLHEEFKKVWGRIDDAIGELCDMAGKQTNIIVLSDHGFGTNDEVFKLNVWLERQGYLIWRKSQKKLLRQVRQAVCSYGKAIARKVKLHKFAPKLYNWGRTQKIKLAENLVEKIDLERSIAFDPGHTMPFGGVYINERLVETAEKKQQLIREIAEKLRNWTDERSVKVDIWPRDGSPGVGTNTGPDLIIGVDDWRCVILKDRTDGPIFERRPYSARHTGSHRMNGIFAAAGPDIRKHAMDSISVFDIAPTVMYLFDLAAGRQMDGRILKDIVTAEYLARHPVKPRSEAQTAGSGAKVDGAGIAITGEEQDAIQQHLKELGYM